MSPVRASQKETGPSDVETFLQLPAGTVPPERSASTNPTGTNQPVGFMKAVRNTDTCTRSSCMKCSGGGDSCASCLYMSLDIYAVHPFYRISSIYCQPDVLLVDKNTILHARGATILRAMHQQSRSVMTGARNEISL